MKNDPRIEFTSYFNKQRKVAPLEIKEAFLETIDLLEEDENHPALRNHALKEKFIGYRSVGITPDWRAVFKDTFAREQKVITSHMIGTILNCTDKIPSLLIKVLLEIGN